MQQKSGMIGSHESGGRGVVWAGMGVREGVVCETNLRANGYC